MEKEKKRKEERLGKQKEERIRKEKREIERKHKQELDERKKREKKERKKREKIEAEIQLNQADDEKRRAIEEQEKRGIELAKRIEQDERQIKADEVALAIPGAQSAIPSLPNESSSMSAKTLELNARERIVSAEIQLAKAEIRFAELQIEKARAIAASSANWPDSSAHSSSTRVFPNTEIDPVEWNLSVWNHAKLRDTINTSTDFKLLEACKEEFHRRLKVYNNWKARNAARKGAKEQRGPQQLLQEDTESTAMTQGRATVENPAQVNRAQRYFRIPFIRPGDQNVDASLVKRGWWCAHFDGDYVARQMELHPDKAPLFLVAGKDDMQICELTLEETGLSRKKGAEILAQEFEQVWMTNGGREYLLKAVSSGQARPTSATAMFTRTVQSAAVDGYDC